MIAANVLVVDDELDIRELIQEILSDEGYNVTTASSAKEARAARASQDFDLILLDIWMPDTDGITLLKEWSDNDQLNTSVVMMSGHGTVDTAIESTHLGASNFVEKPLSIAKLLPGKDYLDPEIALIIDDTIEIAEKKKLSDYLKNILKFFF